MHVVRGVVIDDDGNTVAEVVSFCETEDEVNSLKINVGDSLGDTADVDDFDLESEEDLEEFFKSVNQGSMFQLREEQDIRDDVDAELDDEEIEDEESDDDGEESEEEDEEPEETDQAPEGVVEDE